MPTDTIPESPALARRILRVELKRLREEAGMTGREVAERLHWSVAKISRLERGEGAVQPTDVQAICEVYGAAAATSRLLRECAARTKHRQWWQDRRFRGVVPPWLNAYLGLEANATDLLVYEPEWIPELLATEEYARAAQRGAATIGLDPEMTAGSSPEARIALAMRRQEILVRAERRPIVRVVLGEAALRRTLGNPGVMRRQLHRLGELSRLPNLRLQVVPLGSRGQPGFGGPFTVLSFTDAASDVVLRRHLTGSDLQECPRMLASYRAAFHHLQRTAADPATSRGMIAAAAQVG